MIRPTSLHYYDNRSLTWAPIAHMAALAARAFGVELQSTEALRASRMHRLGAAVLPPRRGGTGGAIFIARGPGEIAHLTALPEFRARREFRALWLIDSFWIERLPASAIMRHFDVIAHSHAFEHADYRRRFGDRAFLLPWGADALDLGAAAMRAAAERAGDESSSRAGDARRAVPGGRDIDVLRVGRQPPAWDDDGASAAACAAAGLVFHGRPPFGADPGSQQQDLVRNWYGRTKFIVAHSNLMSPASYTHPTREYLSARWTDGLAAGAVIAGCQPKTELGLIDWPGAVVDFPRPELAANVAALAEAARDWTPAQARRNHLEALKRLDWRWRFAALAERLGISPPPLGAELDRLRGAIAAAATEREVMSGAA